MKLGLLTAAFPGVALTEVADWAAGNGFASLEVACWPRGDDAGRRYAGVSHIDVTAPAPELTAVVADLAGRGIEISALGYYPNNMHPDLDHRAQVNDHTKAVIAAAGVMGVPVVNTFIGADASKPLARNIAESHDMVTGLVEAARAAGVKLAIENCPMIFSADEWPGGHNLFYSPATWREVFGWFDDDTLGLNLDPSHLVWQMIDIERVVREFADRIYHVHAKDLMIDREGLYAHGVMSAGMGWQVPRVPGLGEVPWGRFIAALYRAGYQGHVVVEHEDRTFEGTDALVKAGFLIARNTVSRYVV
jgi:sugar phosphate isomerase/epimerase